MGLLSTGSLSEFAKNGDSGLKKTRKIGKLLEKCGMANEKKRAPS